MRFPLFIFLFLAIVQLPGCSSLRSESKLSEPAKVKILTDPNTAEAGILVQVVSPVMCSGEKAGEIDIVVTNFLDEDVFVEVAGHRVEHVGKYFRRMDANGDVKAILVSSGFCADRGLTKHLLRSHVRDGRRTLSDDCVAHIRARLGSTADMDRWIGADTRVSFPISGYLVNRRKWFHENAELPITLLKDQQHVDPDTKTEAKAIPVK